MECYISPWGQGEVRTREMLHHTVKSGDDHKPGVPLLATVLICGTTQETTSLCRAFSLDAEVIKVLTDSTRQEGRENGVRVADKLPVTSALEELIKEKQKAGQNS